MAGTLSGHLVTDSRTGHTSYLHVMGSARPSARRRSTYPTEDAAAERSTPRRAHDVLLPIPDPSRALLHSPAVPIGRPRPVCDGDGRAAVATLANTLARR